MLTCPVCDTEKPPTEFYWRKGKPRVGEGCKTCYCILTASPRHNTPETRARRAERNAKSLGKASHRGQVWTSDEDELVAGFYSDPDITIEELAAELGRTVAAVATRACILRKRREREVEDRRTACMKNKPVLA